MSSAAAWPAGRRRGSSRARRAGGAARDAAGACDRGAQDRRPRRARLLQLVPLRRREHNAVGLLHEEMRRLGSLICRGRPPQGAGGRRARGRPRRLFRRGHAALEAEPLVRSCARRSRAAARRLGQRHRRDRPAHLAGAGEAIRAAHRRGRARLLRRHRADRPQRLDRFEVAWFQSRYDKAGPGGDGADYINCPLTRGQYDAFVAALIAGEKDAFKEWEGTPYFEGCLPIEVMAERGPETLRYGPMKPVGLTDPHAGAGGLGGGAAASGQHAGHALQHGRLPDQAEAWRAGAHLPHDPGPGAGRVRAAGRAAPQHLHQQPEAARRQAAAQGASRGCASPGRSPVRGLCRERRDRAPRRALRRGRAAGPAARAAAVDDSARRPARPYHRRRRGRRRAAPSSR